MSSPIARKKDERTFVHNALNALHRKLSHGRRLDILAGRLSGYFRDAVADRERVTCLDVGCGDLGIMERVGTGVPGTVWQCLDIYDLPEQLVDSPRWQCYKKFNGRDFPLAADSVDIVLFCDMLHHANENIPHLLREAHRVGRTVIVKDILEYSVYSRWMLKAMDFVGNWGYGVPLPKKIFTIDSFRNLCRESGFEIRKMDIGVQIYGHLPILRSILRPEWHFFAILEKESLPGDANQSTA